MSSPFVYSYCTWPTSTLEELCGGKAANLFELRKIPQCVPRFYVITSEAFRQTLKDSGLAPRIKEVLESTLNKDLAEVGSVSTAIRSWLRELDVPLQLREEISKVHYATVPADTQFAVRSSVVGEDSTGRSFAGIHDSLLGVSGIAGVLKALKDVWASAYTERALIYRRHLGLSLTDIRVAVIVQQLIEAQQAGVMFTRHPQTDKSQLMLINSVRGFGVDLVGAGAEGDSYTVDKQTLEFTVQLVEQTEQLVMVPGGGGLAHVAVVDPQRTSSSLTDQQVREIAWAGLAIERRFGRPQDVEFCFDKHGKLFILQSRPVSQIAEYGPAAGNHLVWDNSNIIESYSGVTSPMTFSFIRRVYAIVYHCFAEVMGVSPRVIHANRRTYDNMLGLFRGRVYYNLKNWYRSLRLLPGFQYNSRFMESMMGLKEPLELDEEPGRLGWIRRWFVELADVGSLAGSVGVELLPYSKNGRRTSRRISTAIMTLGQNLISAVMAPHELQSLYYEMEDALLWNWKAPIINDFFVMIFYGVLKKLCESWCGDETGSLQNELICGEGGVESAAPVKMLLQLTKTSSG